MPSNPLAPAILQNEKDQVTLEMYQRELCKSFTVFAQTDTTGIPELLASQSIQAPCGCTSKPPTPCLVGPGSG